MYYQGYQGRPGSRAALENRFRTLKEICEGSCTWLNTRQASRFAAIPLHLPRLSLHLGHLQ